MDALLAWLNALPTWVVGGVALVLVILAVLVGLQFRGFWTAGAKGPPADWDFIATHYPGGLDMDGD